MAGDLRFGFATHFQQGWSTALMPAIAATGVGWIRDDMGLWEPSAGTYVIPATDQAYCTAAHNNGLKVVMIMNGSSRYPDLYDPTAMANRAKFIAQSGLVDVLEIINEPQDPNNAVGYANVEGANWQNLLRTLTTGVTNAVRSVSATVKVIGLGAQGQQILNMIPGCVLDGVVAHPYDVGGNPDPETCYEPGGPNGAWNYSSTFGLNGYRDWVTAVTAAAAPAEYWETEWGTATSASFTQDMQATYIARRMLQSIGLGTDHTLIYEYMDNGSELFGVVVTGGSTHKTAYATVTRVISSLQGVVATPATPVTVSSVADGDTNVLAYAYQGTGKTVVSVWIGNNSPNGASYAGPTTCTLQFNEPFTHDNTTSTVLNPVTGASVPITTYATSKSGNVLTVTGLPITDHPLLIILNSMSFPYTGPQPTPYSGNAIVNLSPGTNVISNALATHGGNTTYYLADGNYTDSNIVLNVNHVQFFGSSPNNVIITKGSGGGVFTNYGFGSIVVDFVQIWGMTIDLANTDAFAVAVGINDLLLQNCWIKNYRSIQGAECFPVFIVSAVPAIAYSPHDQTIDSCRFTPSASGNLDGTSCIAMGVVGGTNTYSRTTVSNNLFDTPVDHGHLYYHCVPENTSTVTGNTFVGADLGAGFAGGQFWYAEPDGNNYRNYTSTITGNTVTLGPKWDFIGVNCLSTTSTSENVIATGNTIHGNAASGWVVNCFGGPCASPAMGGITLQNNSIDAGLRIVNQGCPIGPPLITSPNNGVTAVPSLTASAPNPLGNTSATLIGTVTSSNGTITANGFDWGTTTAYGAHVVAATVQTGNFSFNLAGLTTGTTYHYRATADNASGRGVSADVQFIPSTPSPNNTVVTTVGPTITDSVGNVWALTAVPGQVKLNGTIISYTSGVVEIAYVNTVVWQFNGTNWYSFDSLGGIASGPTTTSPLPPASVPSLTASAPTIVSGTSVTLIGNVTSNNGSNITIEGFDWGTTTAYGTSPNVGTIVQSGQYSLTLSGLTAGQQYHYRARATNGSGVGTSSDVPFKPFVESPNNTAVTTVGPTITDSVGNVWALTAVPGQVKLNGTIISYTSGVVEIAYVTSVVWQLNSVGNWYSFDSLGNIASGPTTTSPLDALPLANQIDWTKAGVEASFEVATPRFPGTNIPNRGGTPFATFTTASSFSSILTAVQNCPDGGLITFASGTYNQMNGGSFNINFPNSITLRGAVGAGGLPSTIWNIGTTGGFSYFDLGASWPANNWATSGIVVRDVLSPATGLAVGSTQVTLSSAPTGLAVGQTAYFDAVSDNHDNDPTPGLVWDHGFDNGVEGTPGDTSIMRPGGGGLSAARGLFQAVKITSIAGSVVQFTSPIWSPYWTIAQRGLTHYLPQLWWLGAGADGAAGATYFNGFGIENINFQRTSGGCTYVISFANCSNSWVKNCQFTKVGQAAVKFGWTRNCEARDCYVTDVDSNSSANYSFWPIASSLLRIENNIMYWTPCACGFQLTTGSVFAYNFITIMQYSNQNWLPECAMIGHGYGNVDFNLSEGNFIPSFWSDWIHGNASYNAFVRNMLPAFDWQDKARTIPKGASCRAANLEIYQHHMSYLGNIMGTQGFQTVYEGADPAIWNIEATVTKLTFIRQGNWNTVDDGIRAAESLGSNTIKTSYLYNSKPPWWGSLPWPWVDAATTPSNTAPSYLLAQTNQAAGYRFANNAFPPAGPVVPTMDTASGATNIATTTATLNGDIISNGGSTITADGFNWGTTLSYLNQANGNLVQGGAFSANISGLTANTVYHYQSRATNGIGTGVSTDSSFTTAAAPTAPSVSILPATNIAPTTATINGTITNTGGSAVTSDGFEWGTSTAYGNSVVATTVQNGSFSFNLTGLISGQAYHYRAKASNAIGQGLSGDSTFTTVVVGAPTVTAPGASNVASTTATLNGNITSNGGQPISSNGFDWGTTAAYGTHVISTTVQSGAYTSNISGLTAGTTYHYRSWAINPSGTGFSTPDVTFVLSAGIVVPTVVQHVCTSTNTSVPGGYKAGIPKVGNGFKINLPNACLANNCLVLHVSNPLSAGAITVTDTTITGGATGNAWTLGKTINNGTMQTSVYVSDGITAGTQTVKVTFGVASFDCHFDLTEFYNVATSGSIGAVNGATTSGTATISAGQIATGTADSLVYQCGFNTSHLSLNPPTASSSITRGVGFTLLNADVMNGHFAQYIVQTNAGTITPSVTLVGATDAFNTVTIELKAAAGAGTAPPASGIRIFAVHHIDMVKAASMIFPSQGNLLFFCTAFGPQNQTVTALSDSVNGAWTIVPNELSNGPMCFYQDNATISNTRTITVSGNTTDLQSQLSFLLYDIVNAAAAPFDVSVGGFVQAPVGTWNAVQSGQTSTISPTTANGLVIIAEATAWNSVTALSGAAGQVFDTVNYAGAGDADLMDNVDGYAHFYNATAGPITFGPWTETSTSSPPNNGTSQETWTAVAFKGGPIGTPPTVSLTAPSAGTVSGTITVSATASATGPATVAGVQFKVDGGNIGAEDQSAPYTIQWNTTTIGDGAHTLTAVARDSGGLLTTSPGVSVTVANGGGGGPIAFVQGNFAVPNSTATIPCIFTGAQSAGDLNVVIIGWDNSPNLTITSVTDNINGAYTLGVPINTSATIQQAMYYRANILNAGAGANTVTVVMSGPATFPDVRILEYSGVATASVVDVTGSVNGTIAGSTLSVGPTTNANDLVVIGGTTTHQFTAAGAGFTRRTFTTNGDIADDDIVSVTGTFTDAAGQTGAGNWVMQGIAFKGAPSGTIPLTTPASIVSGSLLGLNATVSLVIHLNTPVTVIPGILSAPKSRVNHRTLTAINSGAIGPVKSRNTHAERLSVSSGSVSSLNSRVSHRARSISSLLGSMIPWITKNGTMFPSFIQSNSSTPTSTATITCPYLLEQIIGDTNVVIVGWNNATALTISGVSDSVNGPYTLAVAINTIGAVQQAIYYFKNILGAPPGTNVVTVLLSGPASQPDVRILEYSGIDRSVPVDVTGNLTGTSAAPSVSMTSSLGSGIVVVTGGTTSTNFTGPGPSFTNRIITAQGNLADDSLP